MTSVAQRTRQDAKLSQAQSNQVKVANWSANFPTKVDTQLQSVTFVKKLLATSISTITYVRSMFDEEAYAKKSLGGVKLRILREKNGTAQGEMMAGWLVGAFDAIEKGYLKELILFVYLDQNKPEEVYEKYTYQFQFDDEGNASFNLLQGNSVKEQFNMNKLMDTTRSLLRNVLVMTEGLSPLPDSAYISMKLTYQDHTPDDYEPEGFSATTLTEAPMPEGSFSVSIGHVSTKHHNMRIKVDARQDQNVVVNNNYLDSQMETQTQSQVQVQCICQSETLDKIMIKCDNCKLQQHGACYRITDNNQIPDQHYCINCCDDTRPCTDPKLVKMNETSPAGLRATCLFRRILVKLLDVDIISFNDIQNHITQDDNIVKSLIKKLTGSGILEEHDHHIFLVDKDKLQSNGVNKYLTRPRKSKNVDNLTEETGNMTIVAEGKAKLKRHLVDSEDRHDMEADGDNNKTGNDNRFSRLAKRKKSRSDIDIKV